MKKIKTLGIAKFRIVWLWILASFCFTVVAWLVGYWYLLSDKNEHTRVFLERQTERQQLTWSAIANSGQTSIITYFETYVQRPEVAKLLDVANHGNEEQKTEAREALYRLLLPVYKKFLSQNIGQFHFQDRENNSFLRFHLPQTYGDSLNTTRPSIVAVNKYKKAVFGFETGKVAISFRNVFPIEYEGKHVGSVDIGQEFEVLKNQMTALHKSNTYLLAVKANKVIPKLFDKNEFAYTTVHWGGDWIVKDGGDGKIAPILVKKLLGSMSKEKPFVAQIESGRAFSYIVDDNGRKYVAAAIPVTDTENKYSAVLLSFAPAPELEAIEAEHARQILYYSFILLSLLLALSLVAYMGKKMDSGRKKLAAVTQTMGEGLYILDTDGKIEYINESALLILGFSYDECIGKVAHYLFHCHSKNASIGLSECQIYKAVKSAKKYIGIDYFSKKSGDIFAADIISTPLFENGEFSGSVTVFRDITDRIKLEEELKTLNGELGQKVDNEVAKRLETEKSFKTVFEKSPEGMMILSKDGEFLECNPSAAKIVGYSAEELKHKTIMDISPDIQNEYDFFSANASPMFLQNAMNGETQYFEWTHIAKDDNRKAVEVMLAPIVWHGQKVLLCTWKDITELKKLQYEKEASQALMIQQNKLAEMGAMIGAIAHQWKQPLNSIWLMIQEAVMAYEYEETTKESMDKFRSDAGEQVAFMNQTIEDFRNFYKPSTSTTVFSIAKSVNSVISIIKKQLEKDEIELNVILDDEIFVVGLESEFKQVVLNIANNAKDALLSNGATERKNIRITAAREDGSVAISVSDNAGGIDEKILAGNKLFEPYFSTKGESGTGIGLSLSKTIIEKKMGGKLTARNTGEGAEFTIKLAAYEA